MSTAINQLINQGVDDSLFCNPFVGPQRFDQSLWVNARRVGNDGASGEDDLVVLVTSGDSTKALAGLANWSVVGVVATTATVPVVRIAICT